jgi:large subunit ribosomal protein L29
MGSNNYAKAKDLRGQTLDELKGFVTKKEEELFKLQFQHATGQLENTAKPRTVRREIARARTVIAAKLRDQAT